MTPKLKVLLAVTGIALAVDQATKIWTVQVLAGPHDRVTLIPHWLELVHAENPGAAFSAFADVSQAVRLGLFGVFTIVALFALGQMYRQLGDNERLRTASVGLILSGALGNGIDRVYKQTVTDMVKMAWGAEGAVKDWLITNFGTNVWPVWNIADAAILIGVSMFLLEYFFERDQKAQEDPGQSPMDRDEAAPNQHARAG